MRTASLHRALPTGNLAPAMNRVRVIGLILLTALAAWFALRSCGPQAPTPAPPSPPPREAFHSAKPLRVEVQRTSAEGTTQGERSWLDRELRYLLARGKMKVAALEPAPPQAQSSIPRPNGDSQPFVLRLDMNDATSDAQLRLIAPDGIEERTESFQFAKESHLATMQDLARRLPKFLSAPDGSTDWSQTLGTQDAAAYDAFIRASDELLHPDATGFTAPPKPAPNAVLNLERIETLARRQRGFARARALLSLAYLSVGGEDQTSLGKLAETAAERALAADAQLADAHAALGIIRLRRMDWSAAREHLDAALSIDASSLPALEGLACLLMDVGHTSKALPIANRVVALQPGSRGARECATYARIAAGEKVTAAEDHPTDVATIEATVLLLGGARAEAERLLKAGANSPNELLDAVLDASTTKQHIPQALQAITRSAEDESIDAESAMLFGTALRRPDFVFNRMLRLARQNEAVPLRLLWLPQTDFLRRHTRFKEVVSVASLTTYWQDHGIADVCAAEPKVQGCAVKPK
jgi:tetratricopeptide (TPR) repeat protein